MAESTLGFSAGQANPLGFDKLGSVFKGNSMTSKIPFFSISPPMLFGLFLLSNSILSYAPWSLEIKLWLGLFGLLLPAVLAILGAINSKQSGKPLDQREFLPVIPPWGWIIVAILAIAARLTQLTTLFVWPNFDESSYGFVAFQLPSVIPPPLFYHLSQ